MNAQMMDANDPNAFMRQLCGMLIHRYRSEVAAGKVDPVRQKALEPILDELTSLFDEPEGDMSRMMMTLTRLRGLMERAGPLAADASHGKAKPAAGSRAAFLMDVLNVLRAFVTGEVTRPLQGSTESRAGQDLYARLAAAEGQVLDFAPNESRIRTLERDVLRPLAIDAHHHALRHHLMVAEPVWPSASVARDPGGVFFSGASHRLPMLERICQQRGLTLKSAAVARNLEQARWDDLRSANVAVFDLAVEAGPALAAVSYELGISRVLGTRCVVLVSAATTVPFNVDSEPVVLKGGSGDERLVAAALDDVLYGAHRLEGDTSVPATVEFAQRRFAIERKRLEVRLALDQLPDAEEDPLEARSILTYALGFMGPGKPILTLSAWPGRYPEPGARRCFHVTPYRPDWAASVSAAAESACASRGFEYIIGHRVADPRVIRSIWDEICRASHVLVDLTGFNANVALELGLALALGKKTLVIGQNDTAEHLFPTLRKMRVHPYRVSDGNELQQLIGAKLLAG